MSSSSVTDDVMNRYANTKRRRSESFETSGVQGPTYWLMVMKLCETKLKQLTVNTWEDPWAWYHKHKGSSGPKYTNLANYEHQSSHDYDAFYDGSLSLSAGEHNMPTFKMSLDGNLMSTGTVNYHEHSIDDMTTRTYRTYNDHYRYLLYLEDEYNGGAEPVAEPTEHEMTLWKLRNDKLEEEKVRVKAMHERARKFIEQYYGADMTSDRIWRPFEQPEEY